MRSRHYYDEDLTTIVQFDGDVTTAYMFDNDGVYAYGHAKHHPEDTYSEWFGEQLSLARAQQRYARKIERLLIRGTK
jgi:hypothetical protein